MEYTFTVSEGCKGWQLRDFLRKNGVSSAAIRAVKFLPQGITVNGVKANTNACLNSGDIVRVLSADNKQTDVIPQNLPLDIVYESNNAMVVNKPAGMPVHPTRGHVDGTLANAFCGLMKSRGTPMPFRAINRIDKNTSGLVLLGLNSFSVPFLAKSVQKEYVAIVEGQLNKKSGIIDAPIARSADSIITREVNENGKRAVTEYKVLAESAEASVVSVKLLTGRTHQIRVHFSHLGHSLCGDDLYKGGIGTINRHALHCKAVSFYEPLSDIAVECCAPLPEDMLNVLKIYKINWQ